MLEKRLREGQLRLRNRLCKPKLAILPARFPFVGSLARRPVRSALRRQDRFTALTL